MGRGRVAVAVAVAGSAEAGAAAAVRGGECRAGGVGSCGSTSSSGRKAAEKAAPPLEEGW